ncbi:MAG: prepilin-type N-terminal cleavage/methylation domain-containing protein [Flavobacterium sp.]|nr:MAG: prepilin-type N-terminal cleavage/methylation domain-containing protein [Flavobacterium sp.]
MIYKKVNSAGFTLIELMVVVMIVIVLTAIALPSYQEYSRKASVAIAQQEMQKLAEQLERHRGKNFTYRGFNASYLFVDNNGRVIDAFSPTNQTLTLPLDSSSPNIKYTIDLKDSSANNPLLTSSLASGQGWVIKAISSDINNYSLLMTSSGVKCKNKTSANVSYINCGTVGNENW